MDDDVTPHRCICLSVFVVAAVDAWRHLVLGNYPVNIHENAISRYNKDNTHLIKYDSFSRGNYY